MSYEAHFIIENEKSWDEVCNVLCLQYRFGAIILLRGTLGSGKSTFVKAFVHSLGCDDDVSSPTFAVMHQYKARSCDIFHYDIYNKSYNDFMSMGLMESFDQEGWHFVEWGSEEFGSLLNLHGFSFVMLDIKILDDHRREVSIVHA